MEVLQKINDVSQKYVNNTRIDGHSNVQLYENEQ